MTQLTEVTFIMYVYMYVYNGVQLLLFVYSHSLNKFIFLRCIYLKLFEDNVWIQVF
jgi:hypothetical protein